MNIILHDNNAHLKFAPLSLTRPVGNLRMGMFTNDERVQMYFPNATVSFITETYLSEKFKSVESENTIYVDARLVLTENVAKEISELSHGSQLVYNNNVVVSRGITLNESTNNQKNLDEVIFIEERWDLYQKNAEVLQNDFDFYTRHKQSSPLSTSNTIIGDQAQIFLEEGATVEASILNTTAGPIYIAKNAEIMEGSIVRGGLAMAESSALKLGTKVYGAVSLGPHCKVGGEVNNVVFQAYSNKGHDGFLGNAVIGEWCNLGADTNCSNLKNNYGLVKAYSYETKSIDQTNIQFMGVIMGDHSKSGINTMFNTATVVGVSANVYGGDFPPKYIPSFSWGGSDGFVPFKLEKAFEVAENMMGRRKVPFTEIDKSILKTVADNYGAK